MSGSADIQSKPSAFFLMRTASRSNTRIPPIARRSSSPMPCRIAMMSRNKLHKEIGAKNPDLRRCVGHQRLLRRSIEVAQEDARKAVAAVQMDDDSDSDEDYYEDYLDEVSPSPIREHLTNAMKAMVKRRTSSQARDAHDAHDISEQPVSMIRVSSKTEISVSPSTTQDVSLRKASSSLLGTRGRRYASKLGFSRRIWSPSGTHAIAT